MANTKIVSITKNPDATDASMSLSFGIDAGQSPAQGLRVAIQVPVSTDGVTFPVLEHANDLAKNVPLTRMLALLPGGTTTPQAQALALAFLRDCRDYLVTLWSNQP